MVHHPAVTAPVELFLPTVQSYAEVTLLDCNDSFTHNLVQAFLKLGAPVRVFRSHQVSVDDVRDQLGSYLVLSPGPGSPDQAGIAKSLYFTLRDTVPILGVCLGMQTMNEVLGGKTIAAPLPVHGKVSVIEHDGTGIFTGVTNPTPVARYHSLQIDAVKQIEIQSSHDGVIMAFRVPPQTVAVQFHPESFLTTEGLVMLRNFLEGRL